ncbi:MAG: NUDIX hydrolase N-terminal domain-containing protein, partial [Promethearchaeota archaeon]
MLLAEQIALWADKLRDISALGLQFSKNMYDLEHYQRIQDIAMAMLAFATNESLSELEPIRAVLKDLYKSRHQYDSLLSSCFDESCF